MSEELENELFDLLATISGELLKARAIIEALLLLNQEEFDDCTILDMMRASSKKCFFKINKARGLLNLI